MNKEKRFLKSFLIVLNNNNKKKTKSSQIKVYLGTI